MPYVIKLRKLNSLSAETEHFPYDKSNRLNKRST